MSTSCGRPLRILNLLEQLVTPGAATPVIPPGAATPAVGPLVRHGLFCAITACGCDRGLGPPERVGQSDGHSLSLAPRSEVGDRHS